MLRSPAFYLEFAADAGCRSGLDSVFVLRDRNRFAAMSRSSFASPLSSLRFSYDEAAGDRVPEITVLHPCENVRRRASPAHGWVFGAKFRSALPTTRWHADGAANDDLVALQHGMMRPEIPLAALVAGMGRFADALRRSIATDRPSGEAVRQSSLDRDLSERTARRRFKAMTGLTPKRHADLLRFHAALKRITRGSDSLGQVAQSCRFADQAHLTREFVRRCGLPPGRFVRHWSDRSVRILQDGVLDPSIRLAILID